MQIAYRRILQLPRWHDGLFFVKLGFNAAALIVGLVLGEMCESSLRRTIMLDNGNLAAVFTKPITAVLMIACFAMPVYQ